MSATPTGRSGLRGFRLAEVPERVRLAAYDKLLMTAGSKDGTLVRSSELVERAALSVAAVSPSDRVYWVSREAWDRVMAPRRRARR